MSTLTDALERILVWLEEHESLELARFESLQPGLTLTEIDKITADLPFRLPLEVYELYQWANGTWTEEEFYGQYFLSHVFLLLESAVEIYTALTQASSTGEADSNSTSSLDWTDALVISLDNGFSWVREQWYTYLFPIFWDYDSRGCYAVLGDADQQDATPILDVGFVGGVYGKYDIVFPSLTKKALAEAECYETGIYLDKSSNWQEKEAIYKKYQDQVLRVWRSPDFV